MEALQAAEKFIKQEFPDCLTAFLAGSVVRGTATETSDLDIVVVTDKIDNVYRESFYQFGWPIEAFVNTRKSYRDFFSQEKEQRHPPFSGMCAEGEILKDRNGLAEEIKEEAQSLLAVAPEPYTEEEQEDKRCQLTK